MTAKAGPYFAVPNQADHGRTNCVQLADGTIVAQVPGPAGTARLIAHACNTHAELLAALEGLLQDVENDVASPESYGFPVEDPEHSYHETVTAARAALAKAKGDQQ